MKILSLDSSTKNFSLAVMDGKKILAQKEIILNKILSDSIIPTIDSVLAKAKVPLKKLDGFAVGLGPGSFTSLRVGLSTVKALTFATGKPLVGIPSLDVIAFGVAASGIFQICTLCDAKRNLVYACVYRKRNHLFLRRSRYLLTPLEDLLKRMRGVTLFVGDGLKLFQEEIHRRKHDAVFADEKFWYPKARHLSQLAYRRFLKKEYNDINSLVPLYLYPEHCQVQNQK